MSDSFIVFSDPHLGRNTTANTTPMSRQKLQQALSKQVEWITSMYDVPVVCGGDFFDKYSNTEDVIEDAARYYQKLDYCIAGNHDVINKEGEIGSLRLLDSLYPDRCDFNPVDGAGYFQRQIIPGVNLYSVPHVSSQETFEKVLQELINLNINLDEKNILLLHCNYNLTFSGLTDSTLNVSKDKAEGLLTTFDYVLMGHDHSPQEHLGGRFIVIGNTHPTSFSDISDKRFLRWNGDGFDSIPIWTQDKGGYIEVDWNFEIEGDPIGWQDLLDGAQFVKLTGKAKSSDMKEISRLMKTIWKEHADTLYGLKMAIEVEGMKTAEVDKIDVDSLPNVIAKELGDSPEGQLWKEFTDG